MQLFVCDSVVPRLRLWNFHCLFPSSVFQQVRAVRSQSCVVVFTLTDSVWEPFRAWNVLSAVRVVVCGFVIKGFCKCACDAHTVLSGLTQSVLESVEKQEFRLEVSKLALKGNTQALPFPECSKHLL